MKRMFETLFFIPIFIRFFYFSCTFVFVYSYDKFVMESIYLCYVHIKISNLFIVCNNGCVFVCYSNESYSGNAPWNGAALAAAPSPSPQERCRRSVITPYSPPATTSTSTTTPSPTPSCPRIITPFSVVPRRASAFYSFCNFGTTWRTATKVRGKSNDL